MSKEIAFTIFNDVHLGVGNEEAVLVSIRHMIQFMLKKEIKIAVFAGDFFHSRSNQTELVLQTASEVLRLFDEAGIKVIAIAGNHDRTSYFSDNSFLDIYKHYPNFDLYTEATRIGINGIDVTLMPFWDDSILVPKLEEAEGGEMLISHFEMQGSANLGKVSEKTNITKKTVKKWKKTYLGHYHNTIEITKDIIHLPSLRQNSFGEDSNKGFTIIYSDLSYEIVPGVFKKFNKIVIDIEETSQDEIAELIELHKNSSDSVRFEFLGTEERLKSLDKKQFQESGIDVKLKYTKKFLTEDQEAPVLIKKFDKDQIFKTFEEFCLEKDYNVAEGLVLLEAFFNK